MNEDDVKSVEALGLTWNFKNFSTGWDLLLSGKLASKLAGFADEFAKSSAFQEFPEEIRDEVKGVLNTYPQVISKVSGVGEFGLLETLLDKTTGPSKWLDLVGPSILRSGWSELNRLFAVANGADVENEPKPVDEPTVQATEQLGNLVQAVESDGSNPVVDEKVALEAANELIVAGEDAAEKNDE